MSEADKQYSVSYWGSHPDSDNDDCFTGHDFGTRQEAEAFFQGPVQDPPNMPGYYYRCVAFVEIDGPDVHDVRANPAFRKERIDNSAERSEFAMQQGMGLGIDAYNEAMGYD